MQGEDGAVGAPGLSVKVLSVAAFFPSDHLQHWPYMLCLLHATFDPSIIEINGGKKTNKLRF